MPVDIAEPFASIMARMVAAKPQIEKEHADLLGQRYDLADHPAQGGHDVARQARADRSPR